MAYRLDLVSVPIRGLFNLTTMCYVNSIPS